MTLLFWGITRIRSNAPLAPVPQVAGIIRFELRGFYTVDPGGGGSCVPHSA